MRARITNACYCKHALHQGSKGESPPCSMEPNPYPQQKGFITKLRRQHRAQGEESVRMQTSLTHTVSSKPLEKGQERASAIAPSMSDPIFSEKQGALPGHCIHDLSPKRQPLPTLLYLLHTCSKHHPSDIVETI